jgi:hypothetical protein
MTTQALMTVPFHGDSLYLVEHEGQPFVPMRPVCHNLGLGWASQARKLMGGKRWRCHQLMIPSLGGSQRTICMSLRKFPGWLSSIQSSRVRPDIRPKLELYQAECDDALWAYWTQGRAENPRMAQPEPAPPIHKRDLSNLSNYFRHKRARKAPEISRAKIVHMAALLLPAAKQN